jgi:hypothetical protein
MCALLAVGALVAATGVAAEEATAGSVSRTLPQSSQTLRLEYRQVGPDLAPYRETEGLDAAGLKALQIQSLLSQGGQLQIDVWLRLGDRSLRPGRRPLGFTVGQHGGTHLFVVDGLEAIALDSQPLEPGWSSPRLALQWHYVDRGAVRLVWHVGKYAGAVHVGLGTDESPDAPPRKRSASDGDAADRR